LYRLNLMQTKEIKGSKKNQTNITRVFPAEFPSKTAWLNPCTNKRKKSLKTEIKAITATKAEKYNRFFSFIKIPLKQYKLSQHKVK